MIRWLHNEIELHRKVKELSPEYYTVTGLALSRMQGFFEERVIPPIAARALLVATWVNPDPVCEKVVAHFIDPENQALARHYLNRALPRRERAWRALMLLDDLTPYTPVRGEIHQRIYAVGRRRITAAYTTDEVATRDMAGDEEFTGWLGRISNGYDTESDRGGLLRDRVRHHRWSVETRLHPERFDERFRLVN